MNESWVDETWYGGLFAVFVIWPVILFVITPLFLLTWPFYQLHVWVRKAASLE